jgi:hypothetical protein
MRYADFSCSQRWQGIRMMATSLRRHEYVRVEKHREILLCAVIFAARQSAQNSVSHRHLYVCAFLFSS